MNVTAPLRFINLGTIPFRHSQSVYHAVAATMSENTPDTIIICSPFQPYYCLGYHQSYRQVIDPKAQRQLRFPVMRRRLGGGMTYLDSNQLFYQCVFHRSRSPVIPAQVYQSKLDAPIKTLKRINLQAQLLYTNEIEVGGKRIAGIGGGLIGQANVVVGNFLRDFQFESMADIINAPCLEFRSLALQTMRKRITTLRANNCDDRWDELPNMLFEEYCRSLGRPGFWGELTAEEKQKSQSVAEKMTSHKYLNARDENHSYPACLTRLKISGSTSIELTALNSHVSNPFVVLVKHNGTTEHAEVVDKLRDDLQPVDLLRKIRRIQNEEIPADLRRG